MAFGAARLGVLLAAVLALAACGSGTSGFPTPVASGDAGTSTPTSAPAGRITSPDQLADTQACDLLSGSEAQSLGLPATPSDSASAGAKSGCTWDGQSFVAAVLIRTDVGLAGVLANGGSMSDTKIGSHPAKQVVLGSGAGAICLYAIGITDSMRVDVQATAISEGDSRSEALTIAQTIEPKLP
jgi:hypothetical protein